MNSLYQTYLTGLLSAKAGLKYWKEENEKNPSDVTIKQVDKMFDIIRDYEDKIEKLARKMTEPKSISGWIDWITSIMELAKEVLKIWNR